jgi:predicted nucleic acid-binding protein
VSLFVVDASVAAKWVLPAADEILVDEAFELLRRYSDGQIRFVVPDLFWVEVANVLWKSVRRRRWTNAMAAAALANLRERNLPTAPSLTLLEDAWNLATTYDRTVYDCLYVALARRTRAQFVTADEKLANALAAHLPVKWLGAI